MKKGFSVILFPIVISTLIFEVIFVFRGKPVTGFVIGFLVGLVLAFITMLIDNDLDDDETLFQKVRYKKDDTVTNILMVPVYFLSIWLYFFMGLMGGIGLIIAFIAVIGIIIVIIWLIIKAIIAGY